MITFGAVAQPTPAELLAAAKKREAEGGLPPAPRPVYTPPVLTPECKRVNNCDEYVAPILVLGLAGGAGWWARRSGMGWGGTIGVGLGTVVASIWLNILPFEIMPSGSGPPTSLLCRWLLPSCRESRDA